jgi:PemK-like, MazF-like toxin of type II toxin-antitoxin system
MKQWEIYDYPFPAPIGLHPAIILSPNEVVENPAVQDVNVLIVVSIRAGRPIKKFEIGLNGADGLDGLSAGKVLPVFLVKKSDLGRKRGSVTNTRQRALSSKIREVYRFG